VSRSVALRIHPRPPGSAASRCRPASRARRRRGPFTVYDTSGPEHSDYHKGLPRRASPGSRPAGQRRQRQPVPDALRAPRHRHRGECASRPCARAWTPRSSDERRALIPANIKHPGQAMIIGGTPGEDQRQHRKLRLPPPSPRRSEDGLGQSGAPTRSWTCRPGATSTRRASGSCATACRPGTRSPSIRARGWTAARVYPRASCRPSRSRRSRGRLLRIRRRSCATSAHRQPVTGIVWRRPMAVVPGPPPRESSTPSSHLS
jgi:hypothetical protein